MHSYIVVREWDGAYLADFSQYDRYTFDRRQAMQFVDYGRAITCCIKGDTVQEISSINDLR